MAPPEPLLHSELISYVNKNPYKEVATFKRGGWSSVNLCIRKSGGAETYAAKVSKLKFPDEPFERLESFCSVVSAPPVYLHDVDAEVRCLQKCQHDDFVVRLVDAFSTGSSSAKVWIVMEHLPIDLEDVIKVRQVTVEELAVIASCMLQALEFIHSKGVMHRDVKNENLLLSRQGQLKLCDFGLSQEFVKGTPLKVDHIVGSYHTMAPETNVMDFEYDESSDIWSMGVVIFLLTKKTRSKSAFLREDHLERYIWQSYNVSNEHYFESMFDCEVHDFTNHPERLPKSFESSDSTLKRNAILNRSKAYRNAFDFCMMSVVPLPATGTPTFPVKRSDTLNRASIAELMESNLVKSLNPDKSAQSKVLADLVAEVLTEMESAKVLRDKI